MTTALIGSTGFVGGTIARQRRVDVGYHRPDVAGIRGRSFSTLWIAGAPAQKWVANADPDDDGDAITALMDHLRQVQADTVVLMSTVDVYPDPVGVDEGDEPAPADHEQAYGRNRAWLEQAVRDYFARVLVVRLPGLFGSGLRKNLVFDLLHERQEFAHRDSVFQFYDLRRLCDDVDTALAAGLDVVNLAIEPVAAHVVGKAVFGRELVRREGAAMRYDMQTRHAALYGRPGARYVEQVDTVLERMREFVAAERSAG